jgi:hypothetical protein
MWLLETSTLKLHEFTAYDIPEYAILSHTWFKDEVKFHEMEAPDDSLLRKPGFTKVKRFCELAKSMGHKYAWADTACIDKRSSADLTEAINSMFKWYSEADVCIVYLEDVPSENNSFKSRLEAFRASRWFTRGWTLQEMIACSDRRFYAKDWSSITLEDSDTSLNKLCSEITGVTRGVLQGQQELQKFTIAERMSWASHRKTTRPEDQAYSLMGMFNVNIPILYGEGRYKAFRRLQEEIMRSSFDQSLFAWRGIGDESGLLADTPAEFNKTPKLTLLRQYEHDFTFKSFSMTNVGLAIEALMLSDCTWLEAEARRTRGEVHAMALSCSVQTEGGWGLLCIRLRRMKGYSCSVNGNACNIWSRVKCDTWDIVPHDNFGRPTLGKPRWERLVVLEDEHQNLMSNHSVSAERISSRMTLIKTVQSVSREPDYV